MGEGRGVWGDMINKLRWAWFCFCHNEYCYKHFKLKIFISGYGYSSRCDDCRKEYNKAKEDYENYVANKACELIRKVKNA